MHRAAQLAGLLLALLGPSCGDDDGPGPLPDGAAGDAGPALDASPPPDASDATDAADARPQLDAAGLDAAGADAALDAAAGDAGGDAGPPSCPRAARPADAPRFVVVSHPFAEGGGGATGYEVLGYAPDGTLESLDVRFEMGRASGGRIELTPDGEVGLVAQEDGTLGVFLLDESGRPTVVHAALDGSFYAAGVVLDPDGSGAYVLDAQWAESGGGLYRIRIGCDGTVTDEGRVVEAKLPYGLGRVPGRPDRLVLAARDVLGSPASTDVHLLAEAAPPERLASAAAFGDEEAIVSALALTHDGRFALVGDANAFSGLPNRVAVVSLDGDALAPVQVLAPLEDPTAVVASPFGDTALVVSGFGDALFVLDRDDAATPPFRVRGELAYAGGRPQLPGAAVPIERGALRGRVLVAENLGVRQVAFEPGGVRDLGLFAVGTGIGAIVGAIGVTP